jgi:crotonobetainyl-CoA:carnitine CoA-transferase CaiB-like acyl-CoA transferase
LRRALGDPPWAKAVRFGDAYQRWLNQDELHRRVEEWTGGLTPWEVTELLQTEGVAAFPSLPADQLTADRHLLARDSFPTVEHPQGERRRAVAPPWRFSETPARVDQWTPSLGQHNVEVFHGLLGLAIDEVRALEKAKVVW